MFGLYVIAKAVAWVVKWAAIATLLMVQAAAWVFVTLVSVIFAALTAYLEREKTT